MMNGDVEQQNHITMVKGGMNESFREEMEQYIIAYLGPKHLPYQSLIPITVIYSIIFITGLIGNFSTCIVIAKAHYMRTSTNYYLFNLAIADMLTLIFGLTGDRRQHLVLNAISLSIYMWSMANLAQVTSTLTSIWMYVPWILLGICAQLFGIFSFFVNPGNCIPVAESPSRTNSSSEAFTTTTTTGKTGQCHLFGVVLYETEKALSWLQIDVGFSLIASSHWLMIDQQYSFRMLATISVITVLPLIAWASAHQKEAVGLTQLASIIHIMACLHVNILIVNPWGILATLGMILHVLFASLPQSHSLFNTLSLESINVIYPSILSLALVRGFSALSKLSSDLKYHHLN